MNVSNIVKVWAKIEKLPAASFVFHKIIEKAVPYTGTIPFKVVVLKEGHTHLMMFDKKRIRNHLKCVHAMALANFAEFASGLAVVTSFKKSQRGIVKQFNIEYLKKARGQLSCECHVSLPTEDKFDFKVPVEIKNAQREVVAKAEALWSVETKL